MDFIEEITSLSGQIEKQKDLVQTEEATKHALVMPFINLLGYNVFDATEVVPEFIADIGTKKGEKIDYAILKDNEIIMLIECKRYGDKLSDIHTSQLYRYFSTIHTRIGILTDGVSYKFYTDLEETNKMDTKPFLELDMLDIQPSTVKELKRFTKPQFNLDETLIAASDLKYTKEIKHTMLNNLESPDEELVKYFMSTVYAGRNTTQAITQFTNIVKKALNQFMNETLNQRLQAAIAKGETTEGTIEINDTTDIEDEEPESRVITTEEELEGFFTVKSIIREVVDANRILHRDTVDYMAIALDGNRYKQICRLYFNRAKKYISFKNGEGKFTRNEITKIDDIYNYKQQLIASTLQYETPEVAEPDRIAAG